MKIVVLAGLLLLAACHRSPEKAAVTANATALQAALAAEADNMEAMAGNATDADTRRAFENTADDLKDASDDVAAHTRRARRAAP